VIISAIDDTDKEIFSHAVSYKPTGDFKGIKMVDPDGEYVAIIGYDCWTLNAVQMHTWIPQPKKFTSRFFIHECFRYPFEIGNLGLVVGVTPADNESALELNRRIGFRETYRMKDGWAVGVDMVIQEMRREECRWLHRRVA
jgi:RimJ/RimL family protein N-acetyltransferase